MSLLDNSSVLITGGTGSLGKSLVEYFLNETKVRRIAVFSRDELKQHNMRQYFQDNLRLRWFLGDVRDIERLKRALHKVDYVIHAAALKQVDTGEYNPMEFIKTNVLGSQNLIEAAVEVGVEKVIALSTDKASSPINLYGATKLTADKLFIAANNYSNSRGSIFSVVRYGNVMGSRGSVLGEFFNQKKRGIIEITDKRMTRFNIMLEESVQMVVWALYNNLGGEIFVPKIPSFYVLDLAKAISNNSSDIKEVGIRPGEKIHEELISIHESQYTFDLGEYYSITPINLFKKYHNIKAKKLKKDFTYSSNNNINFLNIGDLKKIISKFNYL
jgi:UDP-N-acetylglucosamine 4,6-dehydratase